MPKRPEKDQRRDATGPHSIIIEGFGSLKNVTLERITTVGTGVARVDAEEVENLQIRETRSILPADSALLAEPPSSRNMDVPKTKRKTKKKRKKGR